jgi:hypothetical protein
MTVPDSYSNSRGETVMTYSVFRSLDPHAILRAIRQTTGKPLGAGNTGTKTTTKKGKKVDK